MIKLTKELSEDNIIYEEKGYFSVFNKESMKRVGNIVKCGDKWVYKTIQKEGKEMTKRDKIKIAMLLSGYRKLAKNVEGMDRNEPQQNDRQIKYRFLIKSLDNYF